MSDKVKGLIQLVAVIAFIIGSFIISSTLRVDTSKRGLSSSDDRALFVEVQNIAPAPYRVSFQATGAIKARAEIRVAPQISGRVTVVNDQFFEGGVFEKDVVLFEVEPEDFKLEIQRLEAEIARARTTFNLEEAESAAALAEWITFNGDKPVPALVARKPQKAEAWANLKAAKAQLANAKLDLDRTRYSLPFKGRVLESDLAEGQFVSMGQSYGRVFDISTLEVQASLEDQKLEWLMGSLDPEIVITSKYLGQSQVHKGTLKRSAASFDAQTRFASVSFGFAEQVTDLLPGVFVDIEVQGPQYKDVSTLPAGALQKEGIIWIVNDDQTLSALEPEIIYSDGQSVVVRNLKEPKNIVVSRVSGATEGTRVNFKGAPEPAADNADE